MLKSAMYSYAQRITLNIDSKRSTIHHINCQISAFMINSESAVKVDKQSPKVEHQW